MEVSGVRVHCICRLYTDLLPRNLHEVKIIFFIIMHFITKKIITNQTWLLKQRIEYIEVMFSLTSKSQVVVLKVHSVLPYQGSLMTFHRYFDHFENKYNNQFNF